MVDEGFQGIREASFAKVVDRRGFPRGEGSAMTGAEIHITAGTLVVTVVFLALEGIRLGGFVYADPAIHGGIDHAAPASVRVG